MELIQAAINYLAEGFSVIPVNNDKQPVIQWKPYQEKQMDNGQIEETFGQPSAKGLAIVCGKISGNLEVIDVDCKYDITGNLWKDFRQLIEDNNPELASDLVIAQTRSGGFHLLYYCSEIDKNRKLAMRPTTTEERKNPHDLTRVLIETRGEGGYILAAPSAGYTFIQGGPGNIPNITPDERQLLFGISATFNQIKTEEPPVKTSPPSSNTQTGLSPFEDYNNRADVLKLLLAKGWEISRETERYYQLRRPGKDKGAISATLFKDTRIFYCFSTSTEFKTQTGYNPVQLYTFTEHLGNFSEAAKKLYSDGFGDRHIKKDEEELEQEEEPTPVFPIDGLPSMIQKFINACADTYRTPRDFWAGSVLIAIALAIGNRLRLEDKYSNVPIIWLAIVGDVSTGKTEPLNLCLNWFKQHDNKSIENYNYDYARFQENQLLPKNERDNIPLPACFQYRLIDYTPEALNDAHTANKRGLLIERDELKGWIDDFNRYNKSGEQSNMLSSWFEIPWITNRKTGGTVINIPKPCVFVTGGIQPELLQSLAKDERAESGFLSRMCFIWPDNAKKQEYNEAILPKPLRIEFETFLSNMANIPEEIKITLSANATEAYRKWYNRNAKLTNDEPTGYLKGVYGKLDIIVLRIAIILRGMNYVAEGDCSDRISGDEMKHAIQITEYFRATALKVYKKMFGKQESETINAKSVVRYLFDNGVQNKTLIAKATGKDRRQIQRWLE
jgi:hypothetical protein